MVGTPIWNGFSNHAIKFFSIQTKNILVGGPAFCGVPNHTYKSLHAEGHIRYLGNYEQTWVLVELASMTVLRHLYILWNLFLLNKL